MSWEFSQTGGLYRNGLLFCADTYSGRGTGKNNPAMEATSDVGPIPRGRWRIVGPPETTPSHGPYVLRLEPMPGTETYGRSGFRIHGDNMRDPGNASLGCIVAPRETREAIWGSGDTELTVVAEPPQAKEDKPC